MSSFPLYDNLIKDIPKKDLTKEKKKEFIKIVKNIDKENAEIIYALIQYYYIDHNLDKTQIPYNGMREINHSGSENLTWDFLDFPIELRNILYKFITLYAKRKEEEKIRETYEPQLKK